MAEIEDRTQEVSPQPSPRGIRANHQKDTSVCNKRDSVSRAQNRATKGAGTAFREGFLEEELLLAIWGQGKKWR